MSSLVEVETNNCIIKHKTHKNVSQNIEQLEQSDVIVGLALTVRCGVLTGLIGRPLGSGGGSGGHQLAGTVTSARQTPSSPSGLQAALSAGRSPMATCTRIHTWTIATVFYIYSQLYNFF